MNSDSYNNNYFDIQDILASQERITCKFEVDVPNMGKNDNIELLGNFNSKS